jgi:hypothetical protein
MKQEGGTGSRRPRSVLRSKVECQRDKRGAGAESPLVIINIRREYSPQWSDYCLGIAPRSIVTTCSTVRLAVSITIGSRFHGR